MKTLIRTAHLAIFASIFTVSSLPAKAADNNMVEEAVFDTNKDFEVGLNNLFLTNQSKINTQDSLPNETSIDDLKRIANNLSDNLSQIRVIGHATPNEFIINSKLPKERALAVINYLSDGSPNISKIVFMSDTALSKDNVTDIQFYVK